MTYHMSNLTSPLIELLNQTLAYSIDLKLQAKQAHWNVKGANFISLHELFDQLAATADQHADTIAERVVQLGGVAYGTLQAVTITSSLKPYPAHVESSHQHLTTLAEAIASTRKQVQSVMDMAAADNDEVTADICNGIRRELDKVYWFMTAHLE